MLTKILVVDADEDFRLILSEQLRKEFTVYSTDSCLELLETLRSFRPALLVMDLMASGSDPLTMLELAKNEGLCPASLITSTFYSAYTQKVVEQLQVDYTIRKPCDLSTLISRIKDLVEDSQDSCQPLFLAPSDYNMVTSLLLELGLPTRRKGFRYSRQAILLLLENPELQITKEVYPALGKLFGTEDKAVEKSIRDAIEDAWKLRDDALWRKYFSSAPNGQIPRPSNKVFLTRLAEEIHQLYSVAQ